MDEKELLATIANDVKWIKKELSQKADKWVETGAKALVTTVILYLLGALLGMFKFVPMVTAFANIVGVVV